MAKGREQKTKGSTLLGQHARRRICPAVPYAPLSAGHYPFGDVSERFIHLIYENKTQFSLFQIVKCSINGSKLPVDFLYVASALRLFQALPQEDRKSTRLNSSHLVISYAVFCLKQ